MPDFWEGTNVQIRVKCALLDGRKISSVGRAAPLHGDGQEFESLIFHQNAGPARPMRFGLFFYLKHLAGSTVLGRPGPSYPMRDFMMGIMMGTGVR